MYCLSLSCRITIIHVTSNPFLSKSDGRWWDFSDGEDLRPSRRQDSTTTLGYPPAPCPQLVTSTKRFSGPSSTTFPNPHYQSQSNTHTGQLGEGGNGDLGDTDNHREPSAPGSSPPSTSTAPPVPDVPPSGYRIPLGPTGSIPQPPFPGIERTHEAPFTDTDRKSPVFIGSALMPDESVHPCKIVAKQCYVGVGDREIVHNGRYDLLPFVPAHMEFVPTSHGRVPPGRRPVKGGFEQYGPELYHAAAVIDGTKIPGKTGTHLGGCNIPYGGEEHVVRVKYEILCWK